MQYPQLRPRARDLFGQVPVTHADIRAWLIQVANIDPDGPRAAEYIRQWSVPEKIRQARLQGRW